MAEEIKTINSESSGKKRKLEEATTSIPIESESDPLKSQTMTTDEKKWQDLNTKYKTGEEMYIRMHPEYGPRNYIGFLLIKNHDIVEARYIESELVHRFMLPEIKIKFIVKVLRPASKKQLLTRKSSLQQDQMFQADDVVTFYLGIGDEKCLL